MKRWTPEKIWPKGTQLSVDTETTVVDLLKYVPDYVIGGIYDGNEVYLLYPENVLDFVTCSLDNQWEWFMHNAAFDLAVMAKLCYPFNDQEKSYICYSVVYDMVERGQVWDTMLLWQLHNIATVGMSDDDYVKSSLDYVVEKVFNVSLDKVILDRDGKNTRMNFSRWIGDLDNMYQEYLDYLKGDIIYTRDLGIWLVQEAVKFIQERIEKQDTFGMITTEQLVDSWKRFGLYTHHIQLKASIVLSDSTRNGITVHSGRVEKFIAETNRDLEITRVRLAEEFGFYEGSGSSKMLQCMMADIEAAYSLTLPRTKTGAYRTDMETLKSYELDKYSEFFSLYTKMKGDRKIINDFLKKLFGDYGIMGSSEVTMHPSYSVLKATGRTSSWGQINIQQIPRLKGMRECFIPKKGKVFVDIDYSAIELVTLSEAVAEQFKIRPQVMRDAINSGVDVHIETAKYITGKEEVTKDDRQKAKAMNFGLPGGMGAKNFVNYAHTSYGVMFTEDEAKEMNAGWKRKYPEMNTFIHDTEWSEYAMLAKAVDFLVVWDSGAMSGHPADEKKAWEISGHMLKKILTEKNPTSNAGNPYDRNIVNRAWECMQRYGHINNYTSEYMDWFYSKQPSNSHFAVLIKYFGWKYTMTLAGRWRKTSVFTEKRNTIFQGLAADGAKLALWKIWKKGFKIAAFVHDQVLCEIPEDSEMTANYRTIERLMVEGMQEVVKGTRVSVEGELTRCWSKEAHPVWVSDNQMGVWDIGD